MARKSKEFSKLLNQKHHDDLQQKGLETLSNRADNDIDIRVHAEGELKMSEVIEEFMAPYLKQSESPEDQKSMIGMGIIAWNLALLPAKKRRKERNIILNALCDNQKGVLSDADIAEFRADMVHLIESLIERKLSLFKNIERRIVDFEMQDSRGNVHLSVMSTI
ncbi:MAG: hypothetical protein VKL39_18560 [Leptolyngbyaceae bacterium]|nr:hypothetical protein [Leptolyngbyaceae bacterium]